MAGALSQLPNNRIYKNAHDSTYIIVIVLEINDIRELPEDIFLVNLKIINQYQHNDLILMVKYKIGKYESGYFYGGSNRNFNLIMCEDKNIILLPL